MIGLGPRCIYCKHFNKRGRGSCPAFPNGIPGRILLGTIDHVNPYEGDHGIQFELDPNLSAKSLQNYKDLFETSSD